MRRALRLFEVVIRCFLHRSQESIQLAAREQRQSLLLLPDDSANHTVREPLEGAGVHPQTEAYKCSITLSPHNLALGG